MITAAPTPLTNIWDQAKNVRGDFIQHAHYEFPSIPGLSTGFDLFGEYEHEVYYDDDNENRKDSTNEAINDKNDENDYYDNSDSKEFIDQKNIE